MTHHDRLLSACLGKRDLHTWSNAQRVLRQMRRRHKEHDGGLEPYRCHHCGGIHIGASSINRPRRMAPYRRTRWDYNPAA